MKVQAYTLIPGVLTITVATPRVEAAPSHRFTFAKLHEDFAAQVRALLREHRQIMPGAERTTPARSLAYYFPTQGECPLYRLLELVPAGTARDVDADFQLEITRLRYTFVINLLAASFLADAITAEAIEWHIERAAREVIEAAGIPNLFTPGDEGVRPGAGTEIDCVVELGIATGRVGVEVPDGAAN